MIVGEVLGLLAVGAFAGVVSTVVSLASIVSYPALLAFGLSPLSANVTNTVALLFTGLGAAFGSRPELAGQGPRVLRLGWLTMLGGATGALLLLVTPSETFEQIAPWLIGLASLLLIRPPRGERHSERGPLMRGALFAVAIYVGYFGAAGGILMLAVLSSMLEGTPAKLNALKNVLSGMANAVAATGFALFGPVDWGAAVPLALGFLLGGWFGPKIARRLPGQSLRYLAAACGLAVAVKLGYDAYTG
ncbi:sulfite exporter TauE/SafE family protein [Nonomuraea sp. MCN248]|uniref:Probable membrane transporter protein n=1 Tax=Nonomuraea corallina TaxID=2989783 RepID=A0ABT4SKZ8_9ACTN|nr:sulfite exporter TauE/SafE family protein [Nonomuraea corallina]MDA0637913.1 sulfite exporter TauE/SafE family protein [Nonomuraea corallina]